MRSFAIRAAFFAVTILAGCSDAGGESCGIPIPNCVVTSGPSSGGFASCSDLAKSPICQGTAWTCPAGTVPMEQCACTYRADAAQYCGSDAGPF